MKKGFTRAGSQRRLCNKCKHKYTPNPKKWAYTEEERKQALRLLLLGGRGVGKALVISPSWCQQKIDFRAMTISRIV